MEHCSTQHTTLVHISSYGEIVSHVTQFFVSLRSMRHSFQGKHMQLCHVTQFQIP